MIDQIQGYKKQFILNYFKNNNNDKIKIRKKKKKNQFQFQKQHTIFEFHCFELEFLQEQTMKKQPFLTKKNPKYYTFMIENNL